MSTQFNPAVAAPLGPQMFPSELPVYVCSVYPGRLHHSMPVRSRREEPYQDENGVWIYFNNITKYVLGPVPKGENRVLPVWPTEEYVSVMYPDGDQGELKPKRTGAPSAAHQVAESLIEIWRGTTHIGQGTHIGIGIIAGPVATEKELAFLTDIQKKHFERKIDIGNQMWAGKVSYEVKALQQPNSEYRMAAEYLGIKTEWNHDWASEGTIAMKTCLACGEPIQPAALACKHCGKDLVTFAQQRGWDAAKVLAKGDEATATEIEETEARVAKKRPNPVVQTANEAQAAAEAPAEAPKTIGQIAKEKTQKP